MRSLLLSAAATALMLSGSSFAEDAGWYASVNGGQAKHERFSNSGNDGFFSEDLKDRQYGVGIGYRVSNMFAVELGYSDFGKSGVAVNIPIAETNGTIVGTGVLGASKVSAYHLSAVLSAPVFGMFDIYGRVGVAQATRDLRGTADISQGIFSVYQKDRKTDAIVGIGAAIKLADRIAATVEVQQLVDLKTRAVNAGLRFSF